jgi:hypothetical protein
VTPDPLASTRLFFDIGGAGAKADAMAIWVVQFAGDRILVLDYTRLPREQPRVFAPIARLLRYPTPTWRLF